MQVRFLRFYTRSCLSGHDNIVDIGDCCLFSEMNEKRVIEKDEMMAPMLLAFPSFQEQWDQFLNEWVDDPILFERGGNGSLPHYLALSDLANHMITKLEADETEEFAAVFNILEDWIIYGSNYVSEAAVVGLLEDLTNEERYQKKQVADFVPWMGPTTRKWLPEVVDFWKRLDNGKFSPLSID